MTTPTVFFMDHPLVWYTEMYMFDLNRHYNRSIVPPAERTADCRSNMYIPVYHTNGRSIKNTIGVVMNCLVGMGLEGHI